MYRYSEDTRTENADVAKVTGVGRDFVNVSGHTMLKNVKMTLPQGICVLPKEGDDVIVMPLENGEYIVLGTVYNRSLEGGSLNRGEILIKSEGGAYIKLKNNGEVEINGMIIDTNGQII